MFIRKLFRRPLFWIVLLIGTIVGLGGYRASTGPANGVSFTGPASTQPVGTTLRIATFNIDGGQGTDGRIDLGRTAKCLQRLDFIGLNEVHGQLFGEPANQAEGLSSRLNLPYLWAPAERQWWHESFGNADFTHLPVKHWQRVVLPSKPFHALRNYVLTDVDWHGTIVHFLTTHTDWKTGGDEQLRIVIDTFLKLPEPAVLMGDLNHPAHDAQLQKLQKTSGVEEAIDTLLEPSPGRVDWIFLRGLKTVDAGSVDFGASDHPAYWAQVKLK